MAWYNGGAWGGLPVARMYEILVDIQNKVNDRLDADVYAPIARAFPCAREVKAFAQEVLDVLVAEAARTTPFKWVTTDGGETQVDLEFLGLDGFSLAGFERPQQTAYWGKLRDAVGKLRYKKRTITGSAVDSWCSGRMTKSADATYTDSTYIESLGGLTREEKFTAEWGEVEDVDAAIGVANAGGCPDDGSWSTGGQATMEGGRGGGQHLRSSEFLGSSMPFGLLLAGGTSQHNGLRFGVGGLEDVTRRRFTWGLAGDAAAEVDTSEGTLENGDTTVGTGSGTYEITLTSALTRAATEDDMVQLGPTFDTDMNGDWIAYASWRVSPQLEATMSCTQIEVWQDIGAV